MTRRALFVCATPRGAPVDLSLDDGRGVGHQRRRCRVSQAADHRAERQRKHCGASPLPVLARALPVGRVALVAVAPPGVFRAISSASPCAARTHIVPHTTMVVQVSAGESSSSDGSLASSSSSPSSRTNGSADVGDANDMRDLIASVLKDRTSEGGAVTKTYSTSPGETCTWYPNKQCTQARTCYDCLNTIISGSPCMVDPYGVCVSMSQYDVSMDFRRALPPNALQMSMNDFPGTNTTYCTNDDRYCAVCRKTWGNPFDNSQLSYLRYCRGEGGCVCIQNCDTAYHNDNVIMQRCVTSGYTGASAKTLYTSVGVMVALCFVFAIATIFVRRWVRRVDRNPTGRPAFRHDQPLPHREPTGPQLGLSGWLSMREKLIQTEREQLNIGDNQTLEMPVIDHVDGPTIIMEAGEGYLPASPSDLISQHTHAGERLRRSTSEPAILTTQTNDPAARPAGTITGSGRMSEV